MKLALASIVLVLHLLAFGSVAHAQDFSGAWDVSGQDPVLGAYSGHASVSATAGGYAFQKIVEISNKLADGRTLALSWEGTGHNESGGLRLDLQLRQQDFVSTLGNLTRGPAQKTPLALTAVLRTASGAPVSAVATGLSIQGSFAGGPQETWVKSASAAVTVPTLSVVAETVPVVPAIKQLWWRIFKPTYFTLPAIQPFVNRPEFQAGNGVQIVDVTGKDWTRAHPDRLLVVQKVPDAIALLEEDLRTSAFRWKLVEKAGFWDTEMRRDHIEAATGMLGGIDLPTGAHDVHGDSGLHQGSWVSSQAWRYLVTNDATALDNVVQGTNALVLMCTAPNDPTQFARAVQMTSGAPSNWAVSPTIPGLSYLQGGNNDMLHGVDLGFTMAEKVLPAGHPLLQQIGNSAKSLATNCSVASKGTHLIALSGIASRLTGDPAVTSTYNKKVKWSPLELIWMFLGEGITLIPEVSGSSGHHLASCTLENFRILGGSSPGFFEKLWKTAAEAGARRGVSGAVGVARPGLLSILASSCGAPAPAGDVGKSVLAECPYPRPTGHAVIDFSIAPDFCLLPYPADPWKGDFMTNPGREQNLKNWPMWTIGNSDNYWKEGPYGLIMSPQITTLWPSMDYLHAYWYGRAMGVIAATD